MAHLSPKARPRPRLASLQRIEKQFLVRSPASGGWRSGPLRRLRARLKGRTAGRATMRASLLLAFEGARRRRRPSATSATTSPAVLPSASISQSPACASRSGVNSCRTSVAAPTRSQQARWSRSGSRGRPLRTSSASSANARAWPKASGSASRSPKPLARRVDDLLAHHRRHEHAARQQRQRHQQPGPHPAVADAVVEAVRDPEAEQAPAADQERRGEAEQRPLLDDLELEVGDLHAPGGVGELDPEHRRGDRPRHLQHGLVVLARGRADQLDQAVRLVPELLPFPGLLHQVDPRGLPGLAALGDPAGRDVGGEPQVGAAGRELDRAAQKDRALGIAVLQDGEAELGLIQRDQPLELPVAEALAEVGVGEDRAAVLLVARQIGEGEDRGEGEQDRGQHQGREAAQRARVEPAAPAGGGARGRRSRPRCSSRRLARAPARRAAPGSRRGLRH